MKNTNPVFKDKPFLLSIFKIWSRAPLEKILDTRMEQLTIVIQYEN